MPELDLSFVDQAVARCGTRGDAVIPILQAIQAQYRYLPEEALKRVCELTEITPAAITGVATFYTQFRHRPVGRHIIKVCHGTACHVKGSALVQDALERRLSIDKGDDTDREGMFTIEKIACLGCCTLAPVVQIEGVTYGHVSPASVDEVLEDFLSQKQNAGPKQVARSEAAMGQCGEIRIGLGSCCTAQGSGKVYQAVQQVLAESGAAAVVKRVGCVGMCHQTPLVEITALGGKTRLFSRVAADEAADIVLKHFKPKGFRRRLIYAAAHWLDRLASDENADPAAAHAIDVRDPPVCAFLGRQKHVATEYCGQIDPTNLEEYLSHGGFGALRSCLEEFSPQRIIEEIQTSGLRGRGGAGFSTGIKWAKVREAQANTKNPHPNPLPTNLRSVPGEGTGSKYVVCNGDEGDPGAFMDRMLLESFPYRIIEGLAIAALAVGANEGLFYIRAEYPLAVKRISKAIEHCRQQGFLGDNIFGSNFRLHLEIKEGAALLSAARKPRFWHQLRAGAECHDCARLTRPSADCGESPRW